jgi:hypothetical protein
MSPELHPAKRSARRLDAVDGGELAGGCSFDGSALDAVAVTGKNAFPNIGEAYAGIIGREAVAAKHLRGAGECLRDEVELKSAE